MYGRAGQGLNKMQVKCHNPCNDCHKQLYYAIFIAASNEASEPLLSTCRPWTLQARSPLTLNLIPEAEVLAGHVEFDSLMPGFQAPSSGAETTSYAEACPFLSVLVVKGLFQHMSTHAQPHTRTHI